jgi:tyrosinase
MSGDGDFVQHNGSFAGNGAVHIPSGNGGGCVKDGPFAKSAFRLLL